MSEVQLQGLLDRTKPSKGDEEAMDMTTINNIRVSKYSIIAIKVGEKVSAQMRKDFEKFNSEHVGEDSVFPTKNGAPKILEQFNTRTSRRVHHGYQTQIIADNKSNALSWQTSHV